MCFKGSSAYASLEFKRLLKEEKWTRASEIPLYTNEIYGEICE